MHESNTKKKTDTSGGRGVQNTKIKNLSVPSGLVGTKHPLEGTVLMANLLC